MLAVIPIIVGFLGSIVPRILDIFSDWRDKKHELAILDRQVELQKLGHIQRMEEIKVLADVQESHDLLVHDASLDTDSRFISALRASVRPVLTYLFFGLFCGVKIAFIVQSAKIGASASDILISAWDEDTSALFSAVIAFWFGRRIYEKQRSTY